MKVYQKGETWNKNKESNDMYIDINIFFKMSYSIELLLSSSVMPITTKKNTLNFTSVQKKYLQLYF